MDRKPVLLQLLSETPNEPFLLFALAKEYENADEKDKAFLYYQQLIEIKPEYTGSYYHYGKLLQQNGQLLKSKDVFNQGIAMCLSVKDFHAKAELDSALEALEDAIDNES